MKTFEGQLTTTSDDKFCIIISRFNDFIGSKLLSGAIDELRRHGVSEDNIDVVKVPGAFEIPVILFLLWGENRQKSIRPT